MREIEQLVRWQAADPVMRWWYLSQNRHLYNREHNSLIACSLVIRRRTKTSDRLMDDRSWLGTGRTAAEAISEALRKAKEVGDA